MSHESRVTTDHDQAQNKPKKSRIKKLRSYAVRGAIVLGLTAFGGGYYAHEHPDKASEFSRNIIGDKWTVELEEKALYVEDQVDQLKFRVLGGDTNPFDQKITPVGSIDHSQSLVYDEPTLLVQEPVKPPEPPKPAPLKLPETQTLLSDSSAGEGVWTVDGLPKTTPEDVLMAKTYIRPDAARPYASVGVLLLDKRRIKLSFTGGTDNAGPGIIPDSERANLLAAFNGGFQLQHASWGMYANGREYKPLRNGYASIAIRNDGAIQIGEWGRTIGWEEGTVAVRQNAKLLVENCELTRDALERGEDPDTWGYFLPGSREFITSRSAVGLTENGDLIVAAGNSISAKNLARALKAAGACTAIQLDINSPYVLTSLVFQQEDGTLKTTKFTDKMEPASNRFLSRQTRDFFYITHDETNYKP